MADTVRFGHNAYFNLSIIQPMPSTLVHMAFGGLVGVGLLGAAFDRRAVIVILVIPALADLDAFATFVPGGHRSVGHTLMIPVAVAGLVYLDTWGRRHFTRLRERSLIRQRWGRWGVHVAWTAVAVYAIAGIGLDLVMGGPAGGVNLFYPFHDQFYRFDGHAFYSTTRGFVQTFIEFADEPGRAIDVGQRGTTREVRISSPVDPSPGAEQPPKERIFPIVTAGWQLLLIATSAFVIAMRLRNTESQVGRDF